MKNVTILGSTGSIGKNACDVIQKNKEKYRITGLAAGNNLDLLIKQINIHHPIAVAVKARESAIRLRSLFPRLKISFGSQGLIDLIADSNANYVIAAINGIDVMGAIIECIRMKTRVCLANKECIVAAGDLINCEIKKNCAEVIPIDSEQSAIFQCIQNEKERVINKIILTASGGPFFKKNIKSFASIIPQEALSHPIWSMGKRISIDSATLMNKALEIIETHFLFRTDITKIEVLIHPQSIVHSMVEFVDSSILAQLSVPDMRIPILYSLTYPNRIPSQLPMLSSIIPKTLQFFPVNHKKFPSIKMAYWVLREGKNAGAVFYAANETAVEFFLQKRISFLEIFKVVETVLSKTRYHKVQSISDIYETIKDTRAMCQAWLQGDKSL